MSQGIVPHNKLALLHIIIKKIKSEFHKNLQNMLYKLYENLL